MAKLPLCPLDELAPGAARRFDVAGHKIAVIDYDGANKRYYPVECWKHGSTFSVETGEALTLPATRPVPVYDVRVDDGQIVVVLDD